MIRSFARAGPCSAPPAAVTAQTATSTLATHSRRKTCRIVDLLSETRSSSRMAMNSYQREAAGSSRRQGPELAQARPVRGIELPLGPRVHAAATGHHQRGPLEVFALAVERPADGRAREERAQVAGLVRDLDELRPARLVPRLLHLALLADLLGQPLVVGDLGDDGRHPRSDRARHLGRLRSPVLA